MKKFRLILILLVAAIPKGIAAPPITLALIDQLYCPAELVVVWADGKRHALPMTTRQHRAGLQKRIFAALSTLPYVCRRYIDSVGMLSDQSARFIRELRSIQIELPNEGFDSGAKKFEPFLPIAPFKTELFVLPTSRAIQDAKQIYQQYCAACHENTNMASTNPAYSLFEMARNQSKQEFLARMLLGIKGTPEIGLSNPLSFSEISAMREFLLDRSTPNALP